MLMLAIIISLVTQNVAVVIVAALLAVFIQVYQYAGFKTRPTIDRPDGGAADHCPARHCADSGRTYLLAHHPPLALKDAAGISWTAHDLHLV